jgi:hypothetical protein
MLDVRTAVLKIMVVSECGCILLTYSRTVCPFIIKEFRYIFCGCKIANTYFCNSILTLPVMIKTDHRYLPRDEQIVSRYTNYLPVSRVIGNKS